MSTREEILPIMERREGRLRIRGAVERSFAHDSGIWHLAVQLIPVRLTSGGGVSILLNRRSTSKRTCPGLIDICGGHVNLSGPSFGFEHWNDADRIERLSLDSAVREANEEIRCDPPLNFGAGDLSQWGETGALSAESAIADGGIDREFSTAYVLGLPPESAVAIWDTDRTGEHRLQCFESRWADLSSDYRANYDSYADGVGRVVKAALADARLEAQLLDLMIRAATHAAS